jgi:hypothetical protein
MYDEVEVALPDGRGQCLFELQPWLAIHGWQLKGRKIIISMAAPTDHRPGRPIKLPTMLSTQHGQ